MSCTRRRAFARACTRDPPPPRLDVCLSDCTLLMHILSGSVRGCRVPRVSLRGHAVRPVDPKPIGASDTSPFSRPLVLHVPYTCVLSIASSCALRQRRVQQTSAVVGGRAWPRSAGIVAVTFGAVVFELCAATLGRRRLVRPASCAVNLPGILPAVRCWRVAGAGRRRRPDVRAGVPASGWAGGRARGQGGREGGLSDGQGYVRRGSMLIMVATPAHHVLVCARQ